MGGAAEPSKEEAKPADLQKEAKPADAEADRERMQEQILRFKAEEVNLGGYETAPP